MGLFVPVRLETVLHPAQETVGRVHPGDGLGGHQRAFAEQGQHLADGADLERRIAPAPH